MYTKIPEPIRTFLLRIRSRVRKHTLRALANKVQKRIVIGSAGTAFKGWVSTDKETLNLLDEGTWKNYFKPDSLDAILAEHVWEHLTVTEAIIAAKNCYTFLKPHGYLRVAVPDGFHPDPAYINEVKPGGCGAGADDHKILYTHTSIGELFSSIGFDVHFYEYFDEFGQFHCADWNPSNGLIQRSKKFDDRNAGEKLAYTSIIFDAVKPVATLHVRSPKC